MVFSNKPENLNPGFPNNLVGPTSRDLSRVILDPVLKTLTWDPELGTLIFHIFHRKF